MKGREGEGRGEEGRGRKGPTSKGGKGGGGEGKGKKGRGEGRERGLAPRQNFLAPPLSFSYTTRKLTAI